jgi:putative hydrolase of the HAD superfamily
VDIEAIAFDVNGTLVDILTEDGSEQVFRAAGHFLTYQGILLRRHALRDLYFQIMKQQQQASTEEHPEFDAVAIWRQIVDTHATDFTRQLPEAKRAQMPLFLAEMSRGVSRHRLRPYPHVVEVLDVLRERFPLSIVTDAQSAFASAELHKVGLLDYFNPVVVSGDYGYRKPDGRLFHAALEAMGVAAERALFVGNDMFRDVFGASQAGMGTVLFHTEYGAKHHPDCVPDHEIHDFRQLLEIVGLGS